MNVARVMLLCQLIILLNLDGIFVYVSGLVPQVHQEGLLRPYKSYADVTLFHYFVPKEASVATFEFAAFMDSPDCPVREVNIFLQHGSYPVMSADNASFPHHFIVNRTSLNKVVISSSFQPHDAKVLAIYNPLPGSWFASAYLNLWDQKLQQEGLGHKCRYSLGSVALWTQISDVTTIPLKATTRLTTRKHFTYYKFYIPSGVKSYTLKVENCHFLTSRWFPESQSRNLTLSDMQKDSPCIHNVFIRERGLPFYKANMTDSIVTESPDSSYTHEERLPFTDSYYYLMVVSETKVSYNITISVTECPTWSLGKSLIQQTSFVGLLDPSTSMKDQFVRMNSSKIASNKSVKDNLSVSTTDPSTFFTCDCVPTFRLTRIKHAQDFSDTFLLEGKEWFTTWLAITDSNPLVPVLGTSFEILPFVDIGGTLSISIHLDELLMNATTLVVHVDACVRKGRPPETFCCESKAGNMSSCCTSGHGLHVSTANLSDVNDALHIPFPEPDTYYISFNMYCEFYGVVVSCPIPEALISLDIRTQPCVISKSILPNSIASSCGSFGYCQEVHKGQFFYTACRCVGGYRGWGCTDDSEATPESILLMTTLLLTLSNLFFIPAIFLALRRRMLTQAFIYFCTMISSTAYHACDQEIYVYCLTRYSVLQFCDFFCSILSFWVTLIALARTPPQYDSVLYTFGAVVIAIGVEYNRTGLLVLLIPFAIGLAFVICIWVYRSYLRRAIITPKAGNVLLIIPGVLLGASGLILFAFVETEDNYRYTHSAWHAIIAISLLYFLPKKPVKCSEGITNSSAAELAPVNNEYQVNTASPVFFITSELDHLVQEPTG